MHKINNIRRLLVVVASLATLFVAGTIAFRMHRASAPERKVPKLPLKVDIALQGVHYTETRQGVKRWDLSAQKAEYNKDSDSTTLSGVRLVVFGNAQIGELTVSAERADYKNATRDVTLSGNVHGKSTTGMEFSTPSVSFIAAKSQLRTAERVRFSDGGLHLEGVGMEFQTQTRRLKLMKDVTALYQPRGVR